MKLLTLTTLAIVLAYAGVALASPDGRARSLSGPPPIHGVQFDDAQDDKVFAILHTLEPQRREQQRLLRQSQDGLHALVTSGQYDEAKAALLAKTAGNAMAALALLDARADARIRALMTPEQRREADQYRLPRHPRLER